MSRAFGFFLLGTNSMWFAPLHVPSFSCSLTACRHSLVFSLSIISSAPLFCLLVGCSSPHFLFASPPSQPISASYEVWKMIICRMKWTEFAGLMAWQNESRPSSPSITTPRRPRLRSVKVLAYWLLVVTTKCLIQCSRRGTRSEGEGGRWWVEGTAGGFSALEKIFFW